MKNKTESYTKMQKEYYENSNIPSASVVGNYQWHENFPYETQLLYRNGDLRMPIVTDLKNKVALDFGCGPGRMISRMSKLFKRVDGADISRNLISEAEKKHPESNFYLSSGSDLGSAPKNTYDFVYSTIAMQHIAVHSIRMNILKEMSRVLRNGGKFTIQMAFNADYPYVINKGSISFGNYKCRILKKDKIHAFWKEDKVTAEATNSSCDVTINYQDIPDVVNDFEKLFDEVTFWFYDVRLIYNDLNGEKHAPGYWPSHWIFISGVNNVESKIENTIADNKRKKIWTQKNNEFNVRDIRKRNFLFETIKGLARESRYYEPTKVYIKNKILKND